MDEQLQRTIDEAAAKYRLRMYAPRGELTREAKKIVAAFGLDAADVARVAGLIGARILEARNDWQMNIIEKGRIR